MKKIRPFNLILWLGTLLAILFLVFALLFFVGKWSQEKAKNEPVVQEPVTTQTAEPVTQPTQQSTVYVPVRETPTPQQPTAPVETPQNPTPAQPQPIVEAPKGILETVFDGLNELVTIKIGG